MEMKQDGIGKPKDRAIPGSLKATVGAYRVNKPWRDRGELLYILLVAKKAILGPCKAPLDAAIAPPMQDRLTQAADDWKELNAIPTRCWGLVILRCIAMLGNQNPAATGFKLSKDWSRALQEENICIQIRHPLSGWLSFKNPLDRPGGERPAIFSSGSAWLDGQELWGFQLGEIQKPHLGEIEALQRLETGMVEAQHPENTVATVLKQ